MSDYLFRIDAGNLDRRKLLTPMFHKASIRASLQSMSLAMAGVLLALGGSVVAAPAPASVKTDNYLNLPGQLAQRQFNKPRRLDASRSERPGYVLTSRDLSNRTNTQRRNPSYELYQKRQISPPVSPRPRPDINLINPQERVRPPNYRDRINRNRNERRTPPSRLGHDPLSSNMVCRGGILRQGGCHCRGGDVLREVAGNVYACITRPLED